MNIREWLGKDNNIGIDIWYNKYRFENETFEEWLDRICNGNQRIRELILDKKFLFGGRILSNRGLQNKGVRVTYSNCYVLEPPKDSIESIFDTAKYMARTFSVGGGVGVDISNLAPKGATVHNSAKTTSGAVSFMDLYSMVTGLICQAGRRGALMISISCDHPDVEDFIEIKSDLDKITKANLSIRVTDKFLKAVELDADYTLSFTRTETNETITKTIKAKELFDKFCYMNWDYGEPAFLFWDRIKKWNLVSEFPNFEYAGVNPCAEEPLPPFGACLLGSINLAEFVSNKEFLLEDFRYAVRESVRALNEVLDEGIELHPLPQQRECARDWRQIGLGIFGLADMLIKMEMVYGSDESLQLCEIISRAMINEAVLESAYLAKELGRFKHYNYKYIEQSDFFKANIDEDVKNIVKKYGLRNSQLLTVAPTGTLSTMLGVSGGIEPVFANYYTRKTESLHNEDRYYKIFTPIAWEYLQRNNLGEDETKLPNWFITSQEIPYENRVKMQGVWQNCIDASISSTVNLPKSATKEEVGNIYLSAWKNGLKGITVFRDGCKRIGILTTGDDTEETTTDLMPKLERGYVLTVSDDLVGAKRKLQTGCGSLHLEAYFDELTTEPLETFINVGSTGACERNLQLISRLISTCLRGGIPIETIIDQCTSIKPCSAYCSRTIKKGDTSKGSSCPSAIGFALEELCEKIKYTYSDEEDIVLETNEEPTDNSNINPTDDIQYTCPECGANLVFEGGCVVCKECGWSKCD